MSKLKTLLSKLASSQGSDLYLLPQHAPMIAGPKGWEAADEAPLTHTTLEALCKELLDEAQQATLFDNKRELNMALEQQEGRFRLNWYWQRNALACVIRFIPPQLPSWQDLGLPSLTERVVQQQQGLVLFVGPSGSGKSTSMASFLKARAALQPGHIVTIEDPIEFLHQHDQALFSQREVGLDTPDHASALKQVLRQAPNVVVLGEIRDAQVLQHALNFSQTGHLCVSTFHATSATHALERMLHFFPESQRSSTAYDLSLNLKTIFAQKLLPSTEKGERALAVEVLQATPHVKQLIKQSAFSEIKEVLTKADGSEMMSLDTSLKNLVANGRITREMALQHAISENDLRIALDYNG